MTWCAGLEAICQPDAPLAELTWYRLGGPARWLLSPRNDAELAEVVSRCRTAGIAWRVLGHGANVLVRDAGVDAAVIRLNAPAFQECRWDGAIVHAAGGADFPRIVKESAPRGLAGLAGLAGIPGSVGGIIRMNAGGKYGYIADVVRDVRVLTPAGEFETRSAASIDFGYRHTELHGAIVIGATLALTPGDPAALAEEYRRVWLEKAAAQPAMAARSAGCIFRNPPGAAAGALIDRAGLKGTRRGAAEISTRHANFIVAYPGATAQDVLDLITLAKDRVHAAFDVELETEVEIW
jgi:UDP-N-acetylmuramate dehydrogenase